MRRWGKVWRRSTPALVGLCLILATPAGAQQSEDADAVRLTTDLVLVPVLANMDKGGAIADLRSEELRLFEDGAPQEIAFFRRDVAPIDAVLLIDTSASIEQSLDVIQRAAYSFVKQLRPEDRFSIVTFSDLPVIALDWCGDVKAAAAALRAIEPKGNTALYGSLVAALYERFDERPPANRRALVVLTDGDDTISSVTSRTAARAAQLHEATVYVISTGRLRVELLLQLSRAGGVPIAKRAEFRTIADRVRRSEERITYLADETGGRVYYPKSVGDLSKAFEQAVDEIRSRYILGYYSGPTVASGFHAIALHTTRSGARLFARRGYFKP